MKETLGNVKPARLSITVLGSPSVGKTALTVQYLTGRFIGEYYSGSDMTYRHSVPHFGGSLSTPIEILDISRSQDDVNKDILSSWPPERTGAFLVVYSLTDAKSFIRAEEILQQLPTSAPKYLVANQLDLQHRRQVSRADGQAAADRLNCHFDEFSAAEPDQHHHTIKSAFQKLIRQLISHAYILPCPRIRFSAFSKLLGTLAAVRTRSKFRRIVISPSSPSSSKSTSSISSSISTSSSSSLTAISSLSCGSSTSISMTNNNCSESSSSSLCYRKTLPIPISFNGQRNRSSDLSSCYSPGFIASI